MERQCYYDEDESGLADSAELKLENLKRFINPNAMTDLKNQFMTTNEKAVSSAQDKPESQGDANDKVPDR